ncbi:MAG: hypothetical protein ACE5DZ_06030, partial [Mariprofundus sp.]
VPKEHFASCFSHRFSHRFILNTLYLTTAYSMPAADIIIGENLTVLIGYFCGFMTVLNLLVLVKDSLTLYSMP